MAFDPRQNIKLPALSADDAKDPVKVARWTADVVLRLNQLKTPRFIVRQYLYKFQPTTQVDYNTNVKDGKHTVDVYPTVTIQNVGFTPGAVVLSHVNGTGPDNPAVVDRPNENHLALQLTGEPTFGFYLTGVTIIGNSLSFSLAGGYDTDIGKTFRITVIIFELDSVNPLTASAQNTGILG